VVSEAPIPAPKNDSNQNYRKSGSESLLPPKYLAFLTCWQTVIEREHYLHMLHSH